MLITHVYWYADISLVFRWNKHWNLVSSTLPPGSLFTTSALNVCFYMKRGEKPEGYRQMRPKTFPASNYSGNSQQMLQEIRESLRNLSRPSDAPKADGSAGKGPPDDPRQQGRSTNPRNPHHHRALQEIRKSLMPFAFNETTSSGHTTDINKHMLQVLQDAGFDEVMLLVGFGWRWTYWDEKFFPSCVISIICARNVLSCHFIISLIWGMTDTVCCQTSSGWRSELNVSCSLTTMWVWCTYFSFYQ